MQSSQQQQQQLQQQLKLPDQVQNEQTQISVPLHQTNEQKALQTQEEKNNDNQTQPSQQQNSFFSSKVCFFPATTAPGAAKKFLFTPNKQNVADDSKTSGEKRKLDENFPDTQKKIKQDINGEN